LNTNSLASHKIIHIKFYNGAEKYTERAFPLIQIANKGDSVSFYCTSGQATKWLFSKGPLPDNAYRNNLLEYEVLHLDNVRMINNGTYTCVGKVEEFQDSENVFFENDVTLIVNG